MPGMLRERVMGRSRESRQLGGVERKRGGVVDPASGSIGDAARPTSDIDGVGEGVLQRRLIIFGR